MVLAAGDGDSDTARAAVAALCEQYWKPLYAYVRRRGYGVEESQDLTQEFFARILERRSFQVATQDRGRFRSYLLGAMKHFLADQWDRAQAQKRGGGISHLSLDFRSADGDLVFEPHHDLSPEKLYEKEFAVRLLEVVMERLREEYAAGGKEALFHRLQGALGGLYARLNYPEIAESLGVTVGAVKMAASRLRARYRELLYVEIGRTVSREDEIEQEIRDLFETLGN